MIKHLIAVTSLLLSLGFAQMAKAADDIQMLGEYFAPGMFYDPGPYQPTTVLGTFEILPGDTAVTISGTFGNSISTSSAAVNLFLGSIEVAQCTRSAACWNAYAKAPSPWSYTLTAGQIASLGTGPVNFSATQTAQITIELGQTKLVQSHTNGGDNYYFSDLAFSGGYQTTLTYVNYSPQTVTCTTSFYSDSGSPLSIPFSQGTVSTRTDTMQPGASVHDQTIASPAPPYVQGWAQASCNGPVQAGLLYRYSVSGVPIGEASVNAETAPTTEFATFAQTATGIAYANPSTTQSATVTIEVYNAAGTLLGSHVITLGPLAHGSANVGPLLGLTSFTGFVKITSTIPIISLSLNAEAFPVFSSLPPGDLPSGTALVTP